MLSMTVKKDTHQEPRGGAHRDLPADAPRRPADPRLLPQPLRGDVPEPAEVRLLAGGPAQAQHQARPLDPAHREDHPPRGHRGGDRLPPEAAPQPAGRGRHRPPRQPPGAQRRRAAGEPVPHRPRPDGARDQGEDERLPGDGHGHAPRPHQRQAGHGLASASSSGRASSASSWTRRTRSRRSRTSGGSPPSGRAASAASAPGSRCATCTRPTTAASARSRPRKARTSASSRASAASPASTSSASSRAPTAR